MDEISSLQHRLMALVLPMCIRSPNWISNQRGAQQPAGRVSQQMPGSGEKSGRDLVARHQKRGRFKFSGNRSQASNRLPKAGQVVVNAIANCVGRGVIETQVQLS